MLTNPYSWKRASRTQHVLQLRHCDRPWEGQRARQRSGPGVRLKAR